MTTTLDEPRTTAEPVIEAERWILGTALAEIDHTPGADDLTPADFYLPRHGAIWRAIQDARAQDQPTDPIAIGEHLRTAGDLQRVGGMPYLADCVSVAMGLPGAVGYYARIVRDDARRRARRQLAIRVAQLAEADEDDWQKHAPEVLAQLTDPTGQHAGRERDSWTPLDLGPYLRGEVTRPEPTIGMYRRDGIRFLYPGKEHSVIGEMESGKSWFALACVAAELNNGNTVVYIHFEESDPSDTVERLMALGVPADVIGERFRFIAPTSPVTAAQITRLCDTPPSLVILDGVNEGMSLMGAAIREEDGVAAFRRAVITPWTRVGAAVLTCDHVVKDREARGRYALGSIHKGNALSGALIVLENADPFGRGARGRSHIYVTKDRPGHLRRHGRPTKNSPGKTYVGELIVDDTRTHVSYLDLAILAPAEDKPATPDGDGQGDELTDAVHAVIAALPGQHVPSERELFAQMRKAGWQVRENVIRAAVDDLIVSHRLAETTGKRGAKGYRVVPQQATNNTGEESA
jgi:hypothetical protein